MSKIIDLDKHVSITSAQTIQNVISPLRDMFEVEYFRYLKLYKNGKRVILSNMPDSIRYTYGEGQWVNMWYDGNFPDFLKPGWYSWDINRLIDSREIEEKIENDLISILKVKHGITLVNESKDYFEIYSFDTKLNHIYQADRTLLLRFTYYFKEQARKLIQINKSEMIYYPIPKLDTKAQDPNQLIKFINETRINRYYLSGEYSDVYLTVKELTCIRWMLAGKTVDEIAIIENNSSKTIQHHIENIKIKLNCQKQTQIIKLVLDSMVQGELLFNC